MKKNSMDAFFSKDGPLSKVISGYQIRPSQVAMSNLVNQTILNQDSLVVEAGTGIGKTFAYLAPALIKGETVIISTATKNLQDQLYNKDIPKIRDALKIPLKVDLLKGRSNYICQLKMEDSLISGQFLNKEDGLYLEKIKIFADHSKTGEISEVQDIPEFSTIWPMVTSTTDHCLGQSCEFSKSCFFLKARKEALSSEVVIVNHHLFFADFVLKDEDISEILPKANTVVFDEAHQVPDIASIFFGKNFSTNEILYLMQDTQSIFDKLGKNKKKLLAISSVVLDEIKNLRNFFPISNNRIIYEKINNITEFKDYLYSINENLTKLDKIFILLDDQSPEQKKIIERYTNLIEKISPWLIEKNNNYVYWLDIFSKSVQFNMTPFSVSESFEKFRDKNKISWIFTSATLAVNDSFDFFQNSLGLNQATTKKLDSPFNFKDNACLYVPNNMPDPNTSIFNLTLIKKIFPLINAANGRTFILSTSLKAMREISALLKDIFNEQEVEFPILTQGEDSKKVLIDRFKSYGNAVLIGSMSFWEGIDVRGPLLSLVIIDKLPFQSPGDPVFESKINRLKNLGENPFMTFQLPQAILSLKQGAGRLIRDEVDKGVLMICDSRIIDKPYGKRIWKSLPAFKRTRQEIDVTNFLKSL
jgi:ATP-dependent DNA helicase DinG